MTDAAGGYKHLNNAAAAGNKKPATAGTIGGSLRWRAFAKKQKYFNASVPIGNKKEHTVPTGLDLDPLQPLDHLLGRELRNGITAQVNAN